MIWLIGCKGMLGTEVAEVLNKNNLSWIGSDREVDITNMESLQSFLKDKALDSSLEWIINCAAYTAVDKAEDEAVLAKELNANALINISKTAKASNARLIHISTDYVFDGSSAIPYKENDKANPQSIYGKTKLEGEENIKYLLDKYYIIRTAWLYGKTGSNFVFTMLRLMNEKNELSVVDDQRGSPTYAVDLANAIVHIIKSDKAEYGIYHYSNEGNISWYDFAVTIYDFAKELGLVKHDCVIKPCSSTEFIQKAKRPAWSLLDKTKIKDKLSLSVPEWRNSLKTCLKELL